MIYWKKKLEKKFYFVTYVSLERIGHGESAGNPTECVHHMRRHTTNDARYWIADILCGRDD